MGKHEKEPQRDLLDKILKITRIILYVAQLIKILRDILKG